MFRRICLALTLLTGCRAAKPVAPVAPGTSLTMAYPVVLIGQGNITVRDDEAALTSTTLASGLNFTECKIADSAGAVYAIKAAPVVGPSSAWWRDMGTSQQAHFLEVERHPKSSLEDIKLLLLEQIASPQGVWAGNPNAVAKVKAFKNVPRLIFAARESWDWSN